MSLISAGIFSPMPMVTKSPGTKSLAGTFDCSASRRTRTSEGSIPLMDAITRDVEKSCQALKIAWRKRTIKRTTASARLEGFGLGSPRGFLLMSKNQLNGIKNPGISYQAMKQTILAAKRRLPKPPRIHSSSLRQRLLFGGESTFLPWVCRRRVACALSKPVFGETPKRDRTSSTVSLCHCNLKNSTQRTYQFR